MGHPDKVADQISDAILDYCLAADPMSRVACETLVTTDLAVVAGEITTKALLTRSAVDKLVRDVVGEIGYVDPSVGFVAERGQGTKVIDAQTQRVSRGGAGGCDYFTDDARQQVIDQVIHPVLKADRPDLIRGKLVMIPPGKAMPKLADGDVGCHVNPTGCFLEGGPHGDCGLTGRKIIVDTYGGRGRHGGGAFSGKDPTKVDRSAAYMARYIAKNIVKAGLASQCEVQLSYAIGYPEPLNIWVSTYGTTSNGLTDEQLVDLI